MTKKEKKEKLNLNLITKQELNVRIEKPHTLEQITIHNQIYKTGHKNRSMTGNQHIVFLF
jgi:predicted component of type VI protein secretion system